MKSTQIVNIVFSFISGFLATGKMQGIRKPVENRKNAWKKVL